MKLAILTVSFLLALPNLFAQLQPAQGLPSMRETTTPVVLLTGKVLTEANTPPPESVTVALNCGGINSVAQTQSDGKGFFSVSVALTDGRSTPVSPQNGASTPSTSQLENCELVADLSGYTAEPLRINRGGDIGVVNVGTIILRSIAPEQGFTVSATSLAAPDKAKDAFAKGEEQKNKGKWSAAIASFRKAIAAYPRFALAWLELGRVQARQNDFADASQSFHESVTHDSKLADGYVEDHVSTYLKLAPQAADAQNAQKLLRELQQRSSQTSAAK